ncbi:transposase, partial [Porphyromonas levii]
YKLIAFLNMCCLGECTGISFVDSTPLRACHIKRERSHKTMKGLATKGKCTMGWFYGFKLHIVINDKGEIIKYQITPANVDDRAPLKDDAFT